MKRKAILLLGLITVLTILLVSAQKNDEPVIVTKKLSDNLYVLYGGNGQGSNIGVLIGDDGILLIDAMKAESHDKIMHEIRQISDQPIKYVISTHSDLDHTGGNDRFAASGAAIIMQENALHEGVSGTSYFKNRFTLNFGKETIIAEAVVSHAFSDAIIYLKNNNAVFMGDTFTNTWHPTFSSGGIAGQHKAIAIATAFGDENTAVVPGHGLIDDHTGLLRYKRNTDLALERITILHQQEKKVDEILLDDELNGLFKAFTLTHDTNPIPAISRKRFVERVISADLVKGININEEKLESIRGKYTYDDGATDEVIIREGKAFIIKESPYQYMAELTPLSDTRFHIRGSINGYVVFSRGESGIIKQLTYQSEGKESVAKTVGKDRQ